MGVFIKQKNRGEITAVFATISLLAIMIASVIGLRATQDIRNKAAGSCSYYSTASVVKTDRSAVRTSDNGNKTMSIKNDLNVRNTLDSNGTFPFGTQTFNFGAYKKPSTSATVTLENLDPNIWRVKSTFCIQKPGSSVGCELGAKGVGSTKLTMQYFHVDCGVDIEYGWVVEPVIGIPATPTPTPRSLQTFPTGFANPRLPQDKLTPTITPFSTPTPTTGVIQKAFCNVRCTPGFESVNTCATGFTCVNTCAQGELGCTPSNRGVCRAVECVNDISCGCGKPLIPTLAPFQPTIKPTTQPTVAPLALPCFYDSKLSVVDTSGRNLSVTSLEGRQNQWSVINGTGGVVQFDSHYGSISPLKWGFDTISPNKKSDGLVQTSAFIPVYVPNPSTNTSSLTLRTDPTYEVVQKKIVRHCQREFDQLNGVVRGCSDVNNQGQLRGSYTGIVTAGAPNEIPNVALLCNMHVEAQYVVRKKPTGTARVNVQLSAGDNLSKNIPFTTEQVTLGKHLYAGQSTVTFTGNSSENAGYTKTVTITQPTVDTALPLGNYTVSYNFPSGVLPVREGNDGYRLNSPPIDGTKITITEGNVYTYRVVYNMNTYYCKGTRNKTSCESCNGGKADEIINGAWPNPNGKVLCCPTNRGDKKPGDFSCPNNYDSRCTAGSIYYGNCGHTDPASGKVCPQGQRAKYVCQANNANNFWSYQGCVDSPSGMDRCVAPTPTTVPLRATPRPVPTGNEICPDFAGTFGTNPDEQITPPPECPVRLEPKTFTVSMLTKFDQSNPIIRLEAHLRLERDSKQSEVDKVKIPNIQNGKYYTHVFRNLAEDDNSKYSVSIYGYNAKEEEQQMYIVHCWGRKIGGAYEWSNGCLSYVPAIFSVVIGNQAIKPTPSTIPSPIPPTPTQIYKIDKANCKVVLGDGDYNVLFINDGLYQQDLNGFIFTALLNVARTNLADDGLQERLSFSTYENRVGPDGKPFDFQCEEGDVNDKGGGKHVHCNNYSLFSQMKSVCSADTIVVVSNSGTSRSSASLGEGRVSMSFSDPEAVPHELGHAIAGLYDEYDRYDDEQVDSKNPPNIDENFAPNCTRNPSCKQWGCTNPAQCCMKSCGYANWYRPDYGSIMRNSRHGFFFAKKFNAPSIDAWKEALGVGGNPAPVQGLDAVNHSELPIYHKSLEVNLTQTISSIFTHPTLQVIDSYPVQTKKVPGSQFVSVNILNSENKVLYSQQVAIQESISHASRDGKPVIEKKPKIIVYLPVFPSAKSVQVVDQNGKEKLAMKLSDFNIPDQIAVTPQNMCGNNICDRAIGEDVNSCQADCNIKPFNRDTLNGLRKIKTQDLNFDGTIDWSDYKILVNKYGQSGNLAEDINNDMRVNTLDASIVIDSMD